VTDDQAQVRIPRQPPLSWRIVLRVSLAGMQRRMMRSVVTVTCVVLALAFLAYMLVLADITQALVELNDSKLNILLSERGVDIFAATQMDAMTLLLIGLALLTCTVGVANSMLMSVTERFREIGTMKCLGALDKFIVKLFLFESALLGLLGSLLGALLGILVMWLVYSFRYDFHVPYLEFLKTLLYSGALGLFLAMIAAIMPAQQAARMPAAAALRVDV